MEWRRKAKKSNGDAQNRQISYGIAGNGMPERR